MAYVIHGGVYFAENSKMRTSPLTRLAPPKRLCIPMLTGGKVPASVSVSIGDTVKRGQIIADDANGGSCCIHSPVSGRVESIEKRTLPCGDECEFVVIENDMQYTEVTFSPAGEKKLSSYTSEEIVSVVREAGISDKGAPVHEKLSAAVGNVSSCIVSCCFDEPYVTGGFRLAYEHPAAVINGLKIILKSLGLRRGIVCVGENSPELTKRLRSAARGDRLVDICVVKSKYPGGGECELVYEVTGREIPSPCDPISVGSVVFEAETVSAIYAAFAAGVPMMSRTVSVGGDCVAKPVNVICPVGAEFSELAMAAGGLVRTPVKIIDGGPMSGVGCENADAVVTKETRAVLFLSEKTVDKYEQPASCIRCGRCIDVCPMKLMPYKIARLASSGEFERAGALGADVCDECGLCSYICPGKVSVAEYVRRAKYHTAEANDVQNEEKDISDDIGDNIDTITKEDGNGDENE